MMTSDRIAAGAMPRTAAGGLSRRSFLVGAGAGVSALALSGCVTGGMSMAEAERVYGPVPTEKFPIPAVNLSKVNPKYFRRTVKYDTKEAPGTIIIDPKNYYVYRVEEGGLATRYGANVGRDGFRWNGDVTVGRKGEWATWTPPKEMIARQPELAKYSAANGGMPPGLMNPLGARAMYLFQNGKDTLYRLHGSPEWWSIGKAVSSGCVRLMNQDIIDLYNRVPVKTPVLVT